MTFCAPIIEMCLYYAMDQGEEGVATICKCSVPSYVLLQEYKKIPQIEERSKEDRQQIWDFVNERFPNKTKEEKINCCKVIHTISTLL